MLAACAQLRIFLLNDDYSATRLQIHAIILMTEPTFPEDIERIITETLLDDAEYMCATMSLVAVRFHAWTKPRKFRTVNLRRHDNLVERICDHLLPNARFIHVLAVDLLLKEGELSAAEVSHIQQLLRTALNVNYLAIGWRLWARLEQECGALRLQSIYLMWDGVWSHPRPPVLATPSLQLLKHPTELRDLTIHVPAHVDDPVAFHTGKLYLPATHHCPNIAYMTYAADRMPATMASLCNNHRAAVMFVYVDLPKHCVDVKTANHIEVEKERYPSLSTAYIPQSSQVLGEWVRKSEGRMSVLRHPAPRATG
ncbi:hypothetical protein C8R47DRAFT_148693 [Mycena vitilis]|nr:hypothetical protein C8R47DRAFT_148693 [Mycena vitilis]